jgi:hypothetical protein
MPDAAPIFSCVERKPLAFRTVRLIWPDGTHTYGLWTGSAWHWSDSRFTGQPERWQEYGPVHSI